MQLLYCDESNLEERSGDFLIYGGLMIPAANAAALSRDIDEIRRISRIAPTTPLKFKPCPAGLQHKDFNSLKQKIVEAAIRHEAKLIVYLILHDIARSPDEARRNGINAVAYHFNCLINRFEGPGLILIDQFTDENNQIDAHLTEKFSVGVNLPYTEKYRLSNIVGIHYSAIGQSHFPSVIDIILGSFRFAINAHTRNDESSLATAALLLKILEPLFFREPSNTSISELSCQFSPKFIKSSAFREKYQKLKDFLASAGINISQEITDASVRFY